MQQKALGPAETSAVIRGKILGMNVPQVLATDRLRNLGVPGHLVDAAVVIAADRDQLQKAEDEIIAWYAAEHKLCEAAALRVLNGQATLGHELSAQEAA